MKSVTGPLEESVEALRSKVKDRKKIDLANGEHWACLRLVRRLSVRLLVSARIWPKTLLILISTDRHWYLWEKLMTSFTFSMVLDLDHNTSYLGPWLWYNMIHYFLSTDRHPIDIHWATSCDCKVSQMSLEVQKLRKSVELELSRRRTSWTCVLYRKRTQGKIMEHIWHIL